jgi:tetratricopeptide (TPR) repeat protein
VQQRFTKEAIPTLRLVKASEAEQKLRATALVPLCLNLAQCLIDLQLFREAEGYLDTALHDDPDNAKGLFRMALCQHKLRNDDAALANILKSQRFHDSKQTRALLAQIRAAIAAEDAKAQSSYKNIFSGSKPVYTERHLSEEKKAERASKEEDKYQPCGVCGMRLLRSELPKHLIAAHEKQLEERDEAPPRFEEVRYWETRK